MFGPEAHADQARREAAQLRVAVEQLDGEGGPRLRLHSKHVADDAGLDEDLQRLHHSRRPFPPRLHLVQQLDRHRPVPRRQSEDVGGGDRILNGEIDTHAAHRRHGVGGIADAQQTRAIPALQPVHPYRQEFQIVPGGKLLHPVGEGWVELDDGRAEGRKGRAEVIDLKARTAKWRPSAPTKRSACT